MLVHNTPDMWIDLLIPRSRNSLIDGNGVICVPNTPIATLRLGLQMREIGDIVQRLGVKHAFHKVRMSDPVESNEDTINFASCDELFAFFNCDSSVKE